MSSKYLGPLPHNCLPGEDGMLEEEFSSNESISCNGAVVAVPHSCGGDGNEHRNGEAHYSDGHLDLRQ